MTKPQAYGADQEIIAAVIHQLCAQKTTGYLVLSSASSLEFPALTPTKMDESMRRSLLERNKTSVTLPVVKACGTLKFVDATELDNYFGAHGPATIPRGDPWEMFYKKFANASGMMSISLPGYSTDGMLAIVQVAAACGQTCGGGSFWILQRTSGHWRIARDKTVQGWVS
jgi:hypothetical protein